MFSEFLATDNPHTIAPEIAAVGCEDLSRHLHVAFNQHALNFKKNSTLLLERDECQVVYCVIDGWLALSKALDGGQNQIIDFALPGDIVDPAAADGLSSSVTITALTNGLLAAMPYRSWEKMTCDWPDLQRAAYLVEAAKGARRAERMLRLGKGTAEMRIAYALLEFCIRLDLVCESEIPEFHIPLTQQQLGDYVGLSSVHVCRTMRRMTRNGILEMRNHMDIRVLDSRMLARLAGVDRAVLKREIVPIRV